LKKPNKLTVPLQASAATTALVYPAADDAADTPGAALILGHGAGAGQLSTFMVDFALALSALGIDVITFNFLYTEQGRKIPDRAPALESCYRAVIDVVRAEVDIPRRSLFIGGKSMGGRIATHVAAADSELDIEGLVLLGYPLHPPGRPEQRRDKHLPSIQRPMLVVQGSRDAFGTPAELEPILATLPRTATLHVVPGGDHSFKAPRIDPARQTAMIDDVHRTIAAWIGSIVSK
jgi:uncharacterized protein